MIDTQTDLRKTEERLRTTFSQLHREQRVLARNTAVKRAALNILRQLQGTCALLGGVVLLMAATLFGRVF
jgi:hypothetical protein